MISNYLTSGSFNKDLNDKFSGKFAKKLSLGDWYEILRETVRVFKDKEELFLKEIYNVFFITKGKK